MSITSKNTTTRHLVWIIVICILLGFVLGYVDPLAKYYEVQWEKLRRETQEISRTGTLAEQRDVYKRATEFARKKFGESSVEHALGLQNLSMVLVHLGEFEHASVVLRQLVDIDLRLYGEQSPVLAASRVALGAVELRLHKYAAAKDLLLQAIEVLVDDEDWESTLASALEGFAALYNYTGELGKARILREYLVSWRRERGAFFTNEWRYLAVAYIKQGKYTLAEETYDVVLAEERKDKLDLASLHTFDLDHLGDLSLRTGRFEEAARYFSFLADHESRGQGVLTPTWLYAVASSATALLELGQSKEALATLNEIDPLAIPVRVPLDIRLARYYYNTKARASALQGDVEAASLAFSRVQALKDASNDLLMLDWYFDSAWNLASAYRNIGQPDEAVEVLSRYFEEITSRVSEVAPGLLARLSSELAALHEMLGERALAQEWGTRARSYAAAHVELQDKAKRMDRQWDEVARILFR